MSNKNEEKFQKIRIFWEKYENKVVLGVGLFLVAIISFEAGVLQGHKFEQQALVIEKTPNAQVASISGENGDVLGAQSPDLKAQNIKTESGANDSQKCLFVGSKNSDKFHKPDCRWAKNIKPENLVCFKSEEEAKSRGYVGDKNCIK